MYTVKALVDNAFLQFGPLHETLEDAQTYSSEMTSRAKVSQIIVPVQVGYVVGCHHQFDGEMVYTPMEVVYCFDEAIAVSDRIYERDFMVATIHAFRVDTGEEIW